AATCRPSDSQWPSGKGAAGPLSRGGRDDMSDSFDFSRRLPPPTMGGNALRAMNVVVRPGSSAERVHVARAEGLVAPELRAAGIPATPDHDLVFRGGKTIPALRFRNLFVGGQASWAQADVNDIDRALAAAMSDVR